MLLKTCAVLLTFTALLMCDYKDKLIKTYCAWYKVDYELAKAIQAVERPEGYTNIRYEKKLRKETWYTNIIPATNARIYFSSLGDMQILYGTAVSMGFRGTPQELIKLENNYKYGIKYIRVLINRFWQLEKVIAAYNAGVPSKGQKVYVDAVLSYYHKIKAERQRELKQ